MDTSNDESFMQDPSKSHSDTMKMQALEYTKKKQDQQKKMAYTKLPYAIVSTKI